MRGRWVWLALLWLLALGGTPQHAQTPAALLSPALGLAHISGPGELSPERYDLALALGAGWNRWPLYWDRVQTAPDAWLWSEYDALVTADLLRGLRPNVVLLGIPPFFADAAAPISGLYAPVFADGSDQLSPGVAINPDNPWAVFVFNAVARYRPGGTLPNALRLPSNVGVRTWEIWNEPDLRQFWGGSVADYARLLKVAFLAAKHADLGAQIVFGGLLFADANVNWLARVLLEFSRDPLAARYGYYFDVAAVHSYGDPWRSGWLVQVAQDSLLAYDLQRPIWLTETGVPVWDDYPGPTWDAARAGHVTQRQQAWFLAQSAVYAWSRGASVIFYHQLFDDCGNQPAGTDFPPSGGSCGADVCAGDAFGLARNRANAVCFRQHPQPGSLRPAAEVFRLLAVLFGRGDVVPGERAFLEQRLRVFTFDVPGSGQRITAVWNTTFTPQTFRLAAAGVNAQMFRLDAPLSLSSLMQPIDGDYVLTLPPAQPDNIPDPPASQPSAIGGPPVFILEQVGGAVSPISLLTGAASLGSPASPPTPTLPPATLTPPPTVTPPPTELPLPTATLDTRLDVTPPTATVAPLPVISPPQFTVAWSGQDDTGIAGYVIWVQIDGGDWTTWLNVPDARQTSAQFTGTPGSIVAFAAWAVDLNGNWSQNVRLAPQATTRIQ